jgi:hypothetical protein
MTKTEGGILLLSMSFAAEIDLFKLPTFGLCMSGFGKFSE